MINAYALTFELCWKLMKSIDEDNFLKTEKIFGVKSFIQYAGRIGLIDNVEAWLEFADSRNLVVYTYKEFLAEKVYFEADKFVPFAKSLIERAGKF